MNKNLDVSHLSSRYSPWRADDYSEDRIGRGTEAGTGGDQARGTRDSCLPIRSSPQLDEVRDDAVPGRRTLWVYCPRNRALHQSLQLTSQVLPYWDQRTDATKLAPQ